VVEKTRLHVNHEYMDHILAFMKSFVPFLCMVVHLNLGKGKTTYVTKKKNDESMGMVS
jgi:hypothetical protein